jgi:hypothetical protein
MPKRKYKSNRRKPSVAQRYLLDMVRQHCTPVSAGSNGYDAGFIRVNAEVLHYLCELGMLAPKPGYETWDGFYRGFEAVDTDPPARGVETC